MTVQNHGLPRVVDVQPWSAAAETEVRCGLVVTAINDLAVDSSTWLKAYTEALVPFTMTFGTEAPLLVGEADDPDWTADPNLAAHLVGEAEIAARTPEPPPAAGPPAGVLVLRDDGASSSRARPQAPVSPCVSIGSLSYRCASTGCLLSLAPPPRAALANEPRPAEHRVGLGGSRPAGTSVEDGVFQGEVGDRHLVAELQRLLDAPAAEIAAEQRLIADLWGTR